MDHQQFLHLGLDINEVLRGPSDTIQLNLTKSQIEKSPVDTDQQYLLEAFQRCVAKRRKYYTYEEKVPLAALSKEWVSMGKGANAHYTDFLCGTADLDQSKYATPKMLKFHDGLVAYAGSEDTMELIRAYLRVNEATVQFFNLDSVKPRPQRDVTPDLPAYTFWLAPAS